MADNDFLPFATAVGANVEEQAAYAAEDSTSDGYAAGLARSALMNKTWRQSAVVASQIAQLMANVLNVDILDDGDTDAFLEKLGLMFQSVSSKYAVDVGALNALVVALNPELTAHVVGMPVMVKIGATTTSSTPTLNDGAGIGTIVRLNGGAMKSGGGDLIANALHVFAWDGASFRCLTLPPFAPSFQLFTANGNFTVPTGVYSVDVMVTGGGAGGQGGINASNGGQGGAGGGTSLKRCSVTPGQVIAVSIGAGTAGGAIGGGNASNAGTSSFGAFNSATGGTAAVGGTSSGVGGVGVGGDENYTGSGGQNWTGLTGGQGGGAALVGGATFNGSGAAGTNGSVPGGGGGGGGGNGIFAGGDGKNGQVLVKWGSC